MPSVRHEMAARFVKAQPRWGTLSIEAARLLMKDFSRLFPVPEGVRIRPESARGLEAEWLIPTEETVGTMLYLHGGGYCLGSIDSHRALCARIAVGSGCSVLLIDYRLAPEHPFPAALHDALAAYEWLLEEGTDPGRLLIGGDSAGGGLVLALLVALREKGIELPAGAACLSPWTDLAMTGITATDESIDDPMIRLSDAKQLATLYADGADLRDPLISPHYADPSGFPPLLLQVGTREILLDDSRRFARAARRAGVDVTLEEWADLMHVWQVFAPLVPEAVEAIDALGQWVRTALAGRPTTVERLT